MDKYQFYVRSKSVYLKHDEQIVDLCRLSKMFRVSLGFELRVSITNWLLIKVTTISVKRKRNIIFPCPNFPFPVAIN